MSHLLHGQNGLLLDERVRSLRSALDPGQMGTSVIDVQQSSLPEIAAACNALPFFGGLRVVVLLNPIAIPKRGDVATEDEEDAGGRVKWAELADLFRTMPDTTHVVLRHGGSLSQTHYAVKAVKALGWTIESFPIPRGEDLLSWVSQWAIGAGGRIESTAAVTLLNLLYPTSWQKGSPFETDVPDPRLIATEVEKLVSGSPDGRVTVDLVTDLVADRSGYTAFELNDRVFRGDVSGALQELDLVLEFGEPAERLIASLASEAAALASVNAVREFGLGAVAAAAGISEKRVSTMQRKAAGMRPEGLRAAAEAIRTADAGVKSGRAAETSATIVPLVAGVAEAMSGGTGTGRRRE